MNKAKKTRAILSYFITCCMLIAGCAKTGTDNPPAVGTGDNGTNISTSTSSPGDIQIDDYVMPESLDSYTVSEIKRAYNRSGEAEDNAIMPLYNVEPTESFDFDFKFDWEQLIGVDTSGLVTVHTHPDCLPESQIYTYCDEEEKEDGGTRITISPITCTLATDGEVDDMLGEDTETWGNAPMYYIAVHYDTNAESLQKLDTPVVIPFTVKHELPIPTLKGTVDATGRFKLVWDAVEGADSYNIYSYGNTEYNSTGHINEPVAGAESAFDVNGNCYLTKTDSTTETEFDNFAGKDHGLAIHYHDENDDDDTDYILGQNYCVNGSYFVTAVFGDKESGLSNIVNTADLILPYRFVDEDDIMFARYEDEADLPYTLSVLNIDGSVTERNVYYKFHMGKTLLGTDYPHFRYSVEGTAITGEVSMDITAVEGGVEYYRDRQEGDPPKGRTNISADTSVKVDPENNTSFNPDSDVPTIIEADNSGDSSNLTLVEQQEENTKNHLEKANSLTVENPKYPVFADSAEEEWLACNLMAGNTEISLEPFPSIQLYDSLADVFQKVYYQNPYIMGVLAYKYDYGALTLNVKYCYDKEEISQRQQEIFLKSKEIVEECIIDSMSDEEKCEALYNYLNDNTAYDNEAVEAAKNNNFKKHEGWKDEEDAFNAYGIIVKETGVCQSYALSYKLLCSLCDVESKVITGYLNGNLPHAWNAVMLEGEWYQTDCTNNETNCGIPFFLYSAGEDDLSINGYTEDKLYELDTAVGSFALDSSDKEYYKANGLAAENIEEFKEILGSCLDNPGERAVIRFTGEMPSQKEFVKAVIEVYNMKNMEDRLENLVMGCAKRFIVIAEK